MTGGHKFQAGKVVNSNTVLKLFETPAT